MPFINGSSFTANVVANAALGGVASVAGGGKFANGAETAAFGYLFNSAAGALRGSAWGSQIGAWGAGLLGSETGPADVAAVLAGRWIGGVIGAALGDWLTGPDIVHSESNDENDGDVTRPDGIPDDWTEKDTKKGDGTIYSNPDNPQDNVRVMPGDPNSPYPAQQGPYVKDQIDGKFLTVDGDRVQGGNWPEVHIPLSDYDFSKR